MTTQEAIKLINDAKKPADLFDGRYGLEVYRELAKLVHPDVITDKSLQRSGAAAFEKLVELYTKFLGKAPEHAPVKIGAWIVGAPLAKGDICDLYRAESEKYDTAVFKIACSAKDNDLMDAESATLKILHAGPTNHLKYIPALYDTFEASGRRVNVLSPATGYCSLTDILAQHGHDLHPRHPVWMFNRLLSLLGSIHRLGMVHGAITSDHLLYHADHGLVLVDWCFSVEIGKPLKAKVKDCKIYPVEVKKRLPSSPALDLYMAARVMAHVSSKIPAVFGPIFEWCTAESPKARPDDAWEVQDRWVRAAEKAYGPPSFWPLEIGVH